MIKREELTNPNSCMNRAADDEMTFVLLGRDPAAPAAIRFWAIQRVAMKKNLDDDPNIREALACADLMEAQQKYRKDSSAPPRLRGEKRGSR